MVARFNSADKVRDVADKPTTVNLAGGVAYEQSQKVELASLLLTSFVNDQFYRSADGTVARLAELIREMDDKLFAAKAVVYARTEIGMRSITHVGVAEIAKHVKNEPWVRPFIAKAIHRVDDITEIMSYYMKHYGNRRIPSRLKRGVSDALTKFDAYQLAKYRAKGKEVSLVDVFRLVHPKPADDRASMTYKLLLSDELKSEKTWEARLTKAGQQAEDEADKAERKRVSWVEQLQKHELGYTALVRNIRNILVQAPEAVDMLCEQLTDRRAIKKSMLLPFYFVKAIDAVKSMTVVDGKVKVLRALNAALEVAFDNVPELDGDTLVCVDRSGSMLSTYTQGTAPIEMATLFAAALLKAGSADLMLFGDRAVYHTVNPGDTVEGIRNSILNKCGNPEGTDFSVIFTAARKAYKRIVILSDMQGWSWQRIIPEADGAGALSYYRTKFKVTPQVYAIDLTGYGTVMFPEDKVCEMAGLSEKIFDIMKMLETDPQALVHTIEGVEI